jgi:hypothetical protein
MSVSLQTPQSEFTKGTYFVTGKRLYCIRDIHFDEDFYLIEDCLSLESKWWELSDFRRIRKEVIHVNA